MRCAGAVLCLLLAACQPPKPFDGPLALAPPASVQTPACAARVCPAVYDPICVTFENNGRRMRQTFGNDCEACIASEWIVSRVKGDCDARR